MMGSRIVEISIVHHLGIVFLLLWILDLFNLCHPVAYVASLCYLYLVNERLMMRFRRKVQCEEAKEANQRRVLSDAESVRWLNYAVEKLWPLCMEQIISQKFLLPVVPWFLEKYKPWPAKDAMIQSLYMGRNPPILTYIKVLGHPSEDDHLVMELGLNFLAADDMSAPLVVKLRKILGFAMWAKLYLTGMHLEGKVTVGMKFLNKWPFLGRMRVCFVQNPYIQMDVKPLVNRGIDVTGFPGIAGWIDKLLSVAFQQTFVEPNMVVVDVEKFASPPEESQLSADEQKPLTYVTVEVIEAANLKPADLNGLADPYVKVTLGPDEFRTKVLNKTLTPKWHEEFKFPILTWDAPNILKFEVYDKDLFADDTLGGCTVNILDIRDGKRHDMWIPLERIKMGRLHLAITVLESVRQCDDDDSKGKEINIRDKQNTLARGSGTYENDYLPSDSKHKSDKMADAFEPINIEGQQATKIWIHHPGSEGPMTWEPRKGKSRSSDDGFLREISGSMGTTHSMAPGPSNRECAGTADEKRVSKSYNKFERALRKLGSFCSCRSKKKDASAEKPSSQRSSQLPEDKEGASVKFGKHVIKPEETNSSDSIKPKRHGKGLMVDTESIL